MIGSFSTVIRTMSMVTKAAWTVRAFFRRNEGSARYAVTCISNLAKVSLRGFQGAETGVAISEIKE